MEATNDNTGKGLLIATAERVKNEKSLFHSALKKLVNSNEEELAKFLLMRKEQRPCFLRLISDDEKLILPLSSGSRYIANEKNVFKSFIDSDFVQWGLNKPSYVTKETKFTIYEVTQDASLLQMYESLPGRWDQKIFTQNQIIDYCERFKEYLSGDFAETFFLAKRHSFRPVRESKPEENIIVVHVYAHGDGLGARAGTFDANITWESALKVRLIIPQPIFTES
jgi:hypothetical protein